MFRRFTKSIRNIAPYVLNRLNAETLANGFGFTVAGMGLDFAVPYIFGETVSLLASRASSAVLLGIEMGPWTMIATGATAYIVRVAIIDTRNNIYAPIGPRAFQRAIRDFAHEAVNRSLESKSKSGDDLTCLQKGLPAIMTFGSNLCTQFVPVIGSTMTSAVVLGLKYGGEFSGCLVASVAACAIYNAKTAQSILDLRTKSLEMGNKSFDQLKTTMDYPLTIQSFLKEELEEERVRRTQKNYADSEIKSSQFLNQMARKQDVFQGLVFALMNLLAGRRVLNGELTAGDFAAIQALAMQFFIGFGAFGQAVGQVFSSTRDAEVFFKYIHTPSHIVDKYPDVKLNIAPGNASVEFKQISFAYKSKPETKVLTGVSCLIQAGTKVGFVGATGSGKSTAGKLLFRFMDAISGEVLIGGKNITEVSLKSLRASIGIIEQNPVLLSGTLLENILYGAVAYPGTAEESAINNVFEAVRLDREDIEAEEDSVKKEKESPGETKVIPPRPRRINQFADGSREKKLIDEVFVAAQNAHLTDFIKKDKDGLLMMIEERGANLSGGQVQRVAIARVLMRGEHLKILLLDEATAALDAKTEALIQENIDQIGRKFGLTQIWITHHLSNVINATETFVFDQGTIIQHGSHDKLLSQGGVYAKLWADQMFDKKEDIPLPKQMNFQLGKRQHYGLFNGECQQQALSPTITIVHTSSDGVVSIDIDNKANHSKQVVFLHTGKRTP